MKPYVFAIVVGGLLSCSSLSRLQYQNQLHCESADVVLQAKFILNCIANANPKSDEEPEDWLPMCEAMAQRMYCVKIHGFRYWIRSCGLRTCY